MQTEDWSHYSNLDLSSEYYQEAALLEQWHESRLGNRRLV